MLNVMAQQIKSASDNNQFRTKGKTDILMVHETQQLDFSRHSFGINHIIKGLGNFLNRNALLCDGIFTGAMGKLRKENSESM